MNTSRFGRRDLFRGRFLPHLASVEVAPDVVEVRDAASPVVLGLPPRAPDEVGAMRKRTNARAAMRTLAKRARIEPFACLTAAHQVCTTCVEVCPVPGAMRLDGIRPSVDADLCDGCGRCEEACPAPGGAIRVLPILPTGARR